LAAVQQTKHASVANAIVSLLQRIFLHNSNPWLKMYF